MHSKVRAAAPGATRCAPTCYTRIRWSRICEPSTRWAIRRLFWTETSTGSWKRESGGATEKMTTNTTLLATSMTHRWHDFWRGEIGEWIITRGLRIAMLLIAAVLAARFVSWIAQQVTRQLDEGFAESDALVRSEATKHRQAVASVIQWVSIVVIAIWVIVQIGDVLRFSVGGLVAPAAVLGAALGFGAQQLVKDLLSGFFIIVEKQYGFGDLVSLTVTGVAAEARGTVENVTLRVTRLRSSDGEVFIIPNGQIVKTINLSKDWARAVVDIPVSTSADLNRVNEVLHQECERALENPLLGELLLDEPTVMGIESIEVDTVTLRLVARTLPGKQFEAGRQLRVIVIRALARAGIVTTADATVSLVDAEGAPADQVAEEDTDDKADDAVRQR